MRALRHWVLKLVVNKYYPNVIPENNTYNLQELDTDLIMTLDKNSEDHQNSPLISDLQSCEYTKL